MDLEKPNLAISLKTTDGTGTLNLSGSFSYRDRSAFESKYAKLLDDPTTEKIIIDLAEVAQIDSSALGMLLTLRNYANTSKKILQLSNPSDVVRNVLEIASFQKIFTITG
jgi:anti-anti-sigma factor